MAFDSDDDSPLDIGLSRFPEQNPLELEKVINRVLQYLPIRDVKNCRLVSKAWSKSGLLALRKRSTIVFERLFGKEDKEPSKLFEVFEPSETAPFTAFKIGYSLYSQFWSYNELDTFIRSQQKTIRKLDIDSAYFGYDNVNNRPNVLDVSPWMANTPMTKPNTNYHTKLGIRCIDGFNNVSVKVSAVVNIKELDFSSCTVHLQKEIKINPRDLSLSRVSFINEKGMKMIHVPIKDVVDFSALKKMRLIDTSLILNGNDELTLDCLSLLGVNVTNWNTCRWAVKKLSIWDMDFYQRSEMQVKELYFHYDNPQLHHLNLSFLPISIEKLSVDVTKNYPFSIFSSPFLPKLNSLHLKLNRDLDKCSAFRESPLVEMHLEYVKVRNEEYRKKYVGEKLIELEDIPQTVKCLKLSNVGLQVGDSGNRFHKVVLRNRYDLVFSLLEENCCLTGLKTEALVFHCRSGYIRETKEDFFHFLTRRETCINNRKRGIRCLNDVKRFYAGPLEETLCIDNKSIDTKVYYVYENNKLNVVSELEFLKLTKVGPTDEYNEFD